MLQWWHLMVLQYVAASFHLPSVSTANINTVQYPKPYSNMKYQQSQLLWYPRCCFLSPTSRQPLFTATAVSSTDVSSCLPKYNNHNITKLNFYSVQPLPADPLTLLPTMSNYQHTAVHFNLLMPQLNVLITLFNWVTNCENWIVAEWNSSCRFRLVFGRVYWRRISVSVIIIIHIIFLKLGIN